MYYDNDVTFGYTFIKFDGIEKLPDGKGYNFIDAKHDLVTWMGEEGKKGPGDKLISTLKRIDSALRQNPGNKVTWEFPTQEKLDAAVKFLREEKLTHIIDVRVRKP